MGKKGSGQIKIELLYTDNPEDLIRSCDKKLLADPNNHKAWSDRGLGFAVWGKNDIALMCYNKALAIEPNDAVTWYRKGIVAEEFLLYDEANEAFTNAARFGILC
jgi:tetratricopeptide (TPR) repeat protein